MSFKIEQTSRILILVTGLVVLSILVVAAQLFWLVRMQSEPDLSKTSKYVGSKECRICHPRQYYAWRQTRHSRTLQDAGQDPQAVVGDFTSPSEIRDFDTKDITYTIGGTSIQQYFKRFGMDYYLLPAQYDIRNSQWLKVPVEKEGQSFFQNCAGCHSTGVIPEETRFVEPGVGCEACHGPGSNHIIAPVDKKTDTITNSARLPVPRATIVCGSCHTQGKSLQGGYAYPVGYRPGLHVADVFTPVNREDPRYFWPSGNANEPAMQYLDWLQSSHSNAEVSCINCHTVHAKGNLNPAQTTLPRDKLCVSCHSYQHAVHNTGGCVSCHMPESIGRINPGRIKSHALKPVKPAMGKKFGSLFQQPEYCFTCHEQ